LAAWLWGLTNHYAGLPRRWQEALVGLWPATIFLVSPRQSAAEPLFSAFGMAIVAGMCWYVSYRGIRVLGMWHFLESSGHVMLIDDERNIVFESPAFAEDETLAKSMRCELVRARALGMGNLGFAEKEVALTLGGHRRIFLLKLSRVALPLGEGGYVAVFRDLTAVKRLREQIKQFFELSFHGLVVLGTSGKILRCNRTFAQMLGYGEVELRGKYFQECVSPLDVPGLFHAWLSIHNDAPALENGTCRLRRAGQEDLWVSWSSQSVPSVKELHVVVRDIHKQAMRQEALRRQIEVDSRQVLLLGLVQEAILVYDEDGRLLFGNSAAEQLYSIDSKEVRGVDIHDLLHTRYSVPLSVIKAGLYRTGTWQGEITRLTQDGRNIVVEARLSLSSLRGHPLEIIELGTDVTHSREHNLRCKLLAATVRSTDEAVISTNTDGIVETWNEGASRLFGYGPHEVLGTRLQDLVQPEAMKELTVALRNAGEGGLVESYRDILPHKNGKEVYTSATVSPLRDAEGLINTVSIVAREVTVERMIEREALIIERLKVNGQLAAGIGHELRNSLTTVRGLLQLFRSYPEFSGVKTFLDIALEDLSSASQITNDFLALAGGRTELKIASSLNTVIERVAVRLLPEALARAQTIVLKLSAVEPLCLYVGSAEQLIVNLARNGLHAMADGGTLTIKTEQTAAAVLLQVSDCGEGIVASITDKVWTPFFTTREGHAGLGLNVCENIATLHGAKISFVTTPWGTTFTVAFPRGGKSEEGEQCS